jgi:hypothetical protein
VQIEVYVVLTSPKKGTPGFPKCEVKGDMVRLKSCQQSNMKKWTLHDTTQFQKVWGSIFIILKSAWSLRGR